MQKIGSASLQQSGKYQSILQLSKEARQFILEKLGWKSKEKFDVYEDNNQLKIKRQMNP